jgi:hypothetical protein
MYESGWYMRAAVRSSKPALSTLLSTSSLSHPDRHHIGQLLAPSRSGHVVRTIVPEVSHA